MLKLDSDLLKDYDGTAYRQLRDEAVAAKPTPSEKGRGFFSDAVASMGGQTAGMIGDVAKWVGQGDNAISDWGHEKEKAFDADRSAKLRAQADEFNTIVADPEKDWLDALEFISKNPYFALQTGIGSLPTMVAGGGFGGAAVKGAVATAKMAGIASKGYQAGRIATGIGAGVGEGFPIGAGIYDDTGNNAAAFAGVGLGLAGALMPGNVETMVARKIAGKAATDQALDVGTGTLQRAGVGYAAGRAAATGTKEAGQEFLQEGAEALLTQAGKDETLDFREASKKAVLGAVAGGGTGVALHPFVGEGSKLGELDDAREVFNAAIEKVKKDPLDLEAAAVAKIAGSTVERMQAELDIINTGIGKTTPLQKLTLAEKVANERVLRTGSETAQVAYEAAKAARISEEARLNPATSQTQQAAADAAAEAAADPDNKEKRNAADTAEALVLNEAIGPEGVRRLADGANVAGGAAALEAPTLDAALGVFQNREEVSALRIASAGLQNAAAGVNEVFANASHDDELATADLERTTHEAKLRQQKEQREALKLQQIALKVNQERRKLGMDELPTINFDMVPEATGADTQLESLNNAPSLVAPARLDAAENAMIARRGSTDAAMLFRQFNNLPTPNLQQVLRAAQRGGVEADVKEYIGALVESRAEPVLVGNQVREFMGQPEPRYTLQISPDQQVVDVVDENGDTFDTYRGNQAVHDVTATMDRLNARSGADTQSQSPTFDMQRDGIKGHEVSHTRVPNGNPAFQYAVGRTTEQGIDTVFRRRADEVGTYGGWRWENEISQLRPESQATAEPATPSVPSASDIDNLLDAIVDYETSYFGLDESDARQEANNYLHDFQTSTFANIERDMKSFSADSPHLALAEAVLAKRRAAEPAQQVEPAQRVEPAPATSPGAPAELAATEQAPARIAVAYKNNTHLGNVDQFIEVRPAPAPAPAPSRATQAPAPAAQPRQGGRRRIEADFETRARTALNNGVLEKLGTFWNNVMRGRGQRVFDFNAADMANRATSISGLTQRDLNELKNRYNAELNSRARQWSLDNNQGVLTTLTDPIISITKAGGGVRIELYGLGRRGQNPYKIASTATGGMTVNADGHFTTVSLEQAPGSAELGYRLGAEIDRMAGITARADAYLSTNNPMRRQMQSVFHDTLAGFGPGHVSPLTVIGNESPQGVPPSVWNRATPIQRIGLNILRAAHSVTENRAEGETAARFLENLQYDSRKRIVAVTDPVSSRGFPKGTVVTDAELDQRLGEVDPTIGRGVTARGRTAAGGVGADTAKLAIFTNTILARIENDPNATIPDSWETRAKQIGREIEGWMFSESEQSDAATGVTQEQAEAEVRNMVGDNAAKVLLASGVISFVESGEELTGDTFSDKSGKVQGATMPDGKVVLVLGNLSEETLGPVLAHEALHSTIRNLLGEDTYGALMSRLDTMLKAGEGSQWVKDAAARVPPNTAPEQRLEEIAAYAVELEVKGGTRGNPLVRWARDFMSALRTAIIQNKALPEALRMWAMKNIQPQDLTRLAVAGLKRAAVGEGAGTRASIAERDYAALLEEHRAPGTTNERRSAINTEIAKPRTAQRVRDDANFEMESSRNPRYSVAQEAAVLEAPVAPELPNTFNVLDIGRRTGFKRAEEAVRRAIQDKHVTLRRILQLAKIGSENIKMDTIGALDRLGSILMAEQKRLVDEPLAKMENLLDKAGFTPDEGRAALDRLLIASHVKEYNEHIAEINPVKFDAQGNYVSGFDNDQHPGSGITNAGAAETLRELTSGDDPKTLALLAAQKEYRKMIADMQAFAVDRGLETQETIDSWNKKFPNYTPFNRELDIQENLSIGTVPGSQGFSLRSGIARRAMGSGAEIISPLASTMLWGLKTTTRGENAIVARTFLEFAKAFVPNYMSANGELRPMWKVNTAPNARVVKKMNVYRVHLPEGGLSPEFYSREQAENFGTMQQRAWQAANPGVSPRLSGINVEHMYDGEPQNRVVVQPEPNYQNKPNVMIVPVDGENQMIEFDQHSKDAMAIVEAFKGKATSGAATQTMNKVLTPFRMFSRWVMATSTGFNPVFAVFNAARDVQAAAINAGADKIPGWTAADSAKIAAGFIPAAKGIWKQLRAEFDQMHNDVEAPAPVAGSSADWMQRMVAAGGATGIAHSVTDVEAAETQMRRLFGQKALDEMTGNDVPNDWLSHSDRWITKVGDGFQRFGQGETRGKGEWISKNVVAGIGRLNESAELTTRTLVFKRATELYMGAGRDQATAEKMAANISKNISTNFNRRGNATNVINQLFPFFNAAVQGNARLAETLFEKETYEVKKGDHVLVDQRTKLTPYGKKVASLIGTLGAVQALLLMAAGYDDDEVPKHVKDRAFVIPMPGDAYVAIPMPHGFNLILNAGRELASASAALLSGEPRKMVSHLTDATWGSIAAMSPAGSAGNPVTDWLPALADPFVSIAMNRDAFGRPIAREDMNPLAPTPGFKRAKEGATGVSKIIAEGLNTLTGGDQDRPGMVSPTPDQIDFLTGFAGGGVAREGMKAAQTAGYVVKGALGIEQEALPLHRVPLIGRVVGNTQSPEVIHQKVFTAAKELNTLQARYKGLRERGEKEEAAAFKVEHPELALQDDFAKLTRGESKQKKERVKLRGEGEVGKINAMAEKSETRAQELLRKLEEYRAQ